MSALEPSSMQQLVKTVAAYGTPEAVSSTDKYFRWAWIHGKNAVRTNNTGNVYLGVTATNDEQPLTVFPGGEITSKAPAGCKFNWANWYLDVATNADGVVITYDGDA